VRPKSTKVVYLALTASACLWGAGFAVAKFALREISPLQLLAGSSIFAALTQSIWTTARGDFRRLRLPRSRALVVVALALAGQNVLNGLTYLGLVYTTATNAALLYAFSPVLIAVLAAALLGERWTAGKMAGAVGGFVGVALIITQGRVGSLRLEGVLTGNLIVFGAAVYWASYSVLTRWATREVPAEVFSFYILTVGAVAPTAWAWLVKMPVPKIHMATWLAVAFMGAGAGTVAMNLWNWGLAKIEAARVGMFSYLEPVFASLVAMVFLGERLSLPSVGGAMLVLGSILLSAQGNGSHSDAA